MSSEEEEERRLRQSFWKYQKIMKQFDEIIEIIDERNRPPKRRRGTKGGSSSNDPPPSANQADNEVLVEKITRYLEEIRSTPPTDPNSSTSTHDRG